MSFEDEEFCTLEDDDMGYCERCGGRLGSNGNCEICGDSHKWTWLLKNSSGEVECSVCGTEIVKTRRHCFSCGAKNEAAFKKGDTYCPNCGNALENEICPNCGKRKNDILIRTIKPENTRYCPTCGEKIYVDDYFCFRCGNENYINKPLLNKPVTQQQEKQDEIIIPKRINMDDYRCPECGGYFDMEGFCWKCGVERFTVSVRKLKRSEARHCPVCWEVISIKDKFCPYCGMETYRCSQPEVSKASEAKKEAKIPDCIKNEKPVRYNSKPNTTLWLVLGIISLVICCLPTGIGTIICSIGAKRAINEDDYYLAKKKIGFAKFWFFLGGGIIFALIILSAIVQVYGN